MPEPSFGPFRLFPLLAGGLLVLSGDSAIGSDCAWTPQEATLVFMSSRDGNADIYSVAGDLSRWTNLTRSPASENWPEWSPDGSRIAYQSNQNGKLDVWVMNADGSGAKQLTDDPGEAVHLYVMNADGSAQRRLFPESPGTSTSAKWTSDGQGFLVSRKTGEQGSNLFVVDAGGKTVRQLTDDASSNGAGVFSPDGGRVAFHTDRGEESAIVVISTDGSGRRYRGYSSVTTNRAPQSGPPSGVSR